MSDKHSEYLGPQFMLEDDAENPSELHKILWNKMAEKHNKAIDTKDPYTNGQANGLAIALDILDNSCHSPMIAVVRERLARIERGLRSHAVTLEDFELDWVVADMFKKEIEHLDTLQATARVIDGEARTYRDDREFAHTCIEIDDRIEDYTTVQVLIPKD